LKTDILQKQLLYSVQTEKTKQTFTLPLDKVKEIIQLNKRGTKPELATLLNQNQLTKVAEDKNMFNQNLTSERKLERTFQKRKSKPFRKPHNKTTKI
jgi:hypothetical protein